MKKIFARIPDEPEYKRGLVPGTIISERGLSPRGTGVQMLVGAEGRLL